MLTHSNTPNVKSDMIVSIYGSSFYSGFTGALYAENYWLSRLIVGEWLQNMRTFIHQRVKKTDVCFLVSRHADGFEMSKIFENFKNPHYLTSAC